MEVKREEEVEVKPCIFSSSQTEDKSCMKVWIKAEPCEDMHDTPDLAQGYVNSPVPGKCTCVSKCEEDGLTFSSEQAGISDSSSLGVIKQEDFEFGKGVVVMKGEDFVVELDPNYESGDDDEMESEVEEECEVKKECQVKVECEVKEEYEVKEELESGGMEMCADSSGDMPGAPSKRQGSACLASSGEVAVDVRGRCGSSERSVRSSCGQPCVGAAVSAPSTASSSWEASGVECLPGGNVSAPVQKNSFSERGSGGSEGEVCPSCRKEGVPCPVCMDVSGENVSVEESPEAVQRGRGKKFPCSDCGKVFGRRGDVNRHFTAVHSGEKKFSCSECDKAFCWSGYLKKHMATHRSEKKSFSCSECGNRFVGRSTLNRHMATVHRGEKNFSCSECGKAFSDNSRMKRHVATVHRGEKNFSCSECGKALSDSSTLRTHMATVHRGERKFSCSDCDKAFGDSSSLRMHKATVHRGEKKFSCSECGKAFGVSSHMKRHLATIHRGERKFSCLECGKAFGVRSNLKRHFDTVHRTEK